MNNLVILQARTGSTRLPGKVLAQINGKPMIEWQIKRILESSVRDLVVATTNSSADDELVSICQKLGVRVFRGSISDVHSRYISILSELKPNRFIRVTGDCPLVMPQLLDQMLRYSTDENYDYLSNIHPPTFPDGLDLEIVTTDCFFKFSQSELSLSQLEHVTLGLHEHSSEFNIGNYLNSEDQSSLRWTVDYAEDLEFVREVFHHFMGLEALFDIKALNNALTLGYIKQNKRSYKFRNIQLQESQDHEKI